MAVPCFFASAWCATSPCTPTDCWATEMPDPFARSVEAVDHQIRGLRNLNADATRQLATIRKRMEALDDDELRLVADIDARLRRIDLLLDERLRSAAADGMVSA